jgi:hypothetical protein
MVQVSVSSTGTISQIKGKHGVRRTIKVCDRIALEQNKAIGGAILVATDALQKDFRRTGPLTVNRVRRRSGR